MQRIWLVILLGLFAITASAATEKYVLDAKHTSVTWRASHFGFSNPSGKWYATGTLWLNEENPQDSKLDVTIKMASLETGLNDFNDHLKDERFFNVKKFPTATFVSNRITLQGKDRADVQGMLTFLGVAKPITLHVKLNKIGNSAISNKQTAGFSATAEIKRSDFGMNTYLPGIGDTVELQIEAEAIKVG